MILQGNERSVVGAEFGNQPLEGADGFEPTECLFGIGCVALPFVG
ncbi:MAG: hypothetical protein RLZZ282_969 [Verrucomicrobiota bacterium]